eukprot:TRINITY_DN2459_c7_g1_i1.p1 TRINITY_DN2459_c7_g1~~TRINITY_DN2459_c7_g1_i1.p1  ORF type:complete len:294 (+),score=50.18 TRINITY_DN2459_c7_g1_i1:42-923(+)
MTHPCPLDKMDPSMPPPPCKMEGSTEEKILSALKGFIGNVYGAMDSGAHEQIPFSPDCVAVFQKGESDRFQGGSLIPRMKMLHKGQDRDFSMLSVQAFGNSMIGLVCGNYRTAASEVKAQQQQLPITHRFADFFVLSQEQKLSSIVLREVDEDCGAPPSGAVSGGVFAQGDAVAKQFTPFFYSQLDDPSKRGGLNSMFREQSCVSVGTHLFKGAQHIAHKIHYMPKLINAGARQIQQIDTLPSPANGFFLFIAGICQLEGEEKQQRFFDVVHLMPEGNNFWITNLMMQMAGGV